MTLLLVMCAGRLPLETGPVTGVITAATVWAAPDLGQPGRLCGSGETGAVIWGAGR